MTRILVEAPARLHFGVLDLAGHLGRHFGGLGAAIEAPSLLLEAAPDTEVRAEGPDAGRAAEFARRFLAYHELGGGVRLRVRRALPAHAGLGSGTQLGLAVARALAELHGTDCRAPALAEAVGRGERSAIGTWLFERGGFVLEGGRRPGETGVAPLLLQRPLPATWRYVLVVPPGSGLSGAAERQAFAALPVPPADSVERVAHRVLMQLLPALVEADLAGFGAALTALQEETGAWWAAAQGGTFLPGATLTALTRLRAHGAFGVGQSSWGPSVYGLVDGDGTAEQLAQRLSVELGEGTRVYRGRFAETGARVSRPSASTSSSVAAD